MNKRWLKYTASALLFSALFMFNLALNSRFAAAAGGTYDAEAFKEQSGLDTAAVAAGYATGGNATSLENVIGTIIYVFLGLVGVLFMVLVIYGGLIWMTSQGNEEKVKKANGIIMNSLIGLVITLSAYVISYFIISYFQK